MKLFARRSPPGWAILIAAAIFAALAFYGLCSGEAYMPRGKSSPARYASERKDPVQYQQIIRFQFGAAALFLVPGFVRVVPVEDFFISLQRKLNTRLQTDRTRAPMWAYAFLIAFIGLVVWIGWKVMHSE